MECGYDVGDGAGSARPGGVLARRTPHNGAETVAKEVLRSPRSNIDHRLYCLRALCFVL